MDDTIRIRVARRDYCNYCDILIEMRKSDGSRAIVSNVVFDEVIKQDAPVRESLSISDTAAQALMDNLWECGYRPTEGKGSAGAMRATERHLEDMRKIAFMQLREKQEWHLGLAETHTFDPRNT